MSTVHSVTVTIDGAPPIVLPVISGNLSIDEAQSPRIAATIVCPATASVLALDPQRAIIMATITATVTSRVDLIRDITRRVAGFSLNGLSSLFDGRAISGIIPKLLEPATSTATWRVQLRSVRERWAADTVTLSLKSIEAILLDHRQPQLSPTALAGPNIIDAVNQVLADCGLPAVTSSDAAANAAASAASRAWPRGVSAWQKITELIRGTDMLFWSDNTGGIQLQKASSTGTALTLTSFGDNRSIVDGGSYIDRDDSAFATVVDNHYVDTAGTDFGQSWSYFNINPANGPVFSGNARPFKTLYTRRTDAGMISGQIGTQQVKQAFLRGRGWTVKAISDYSVVPARPVTVQRPSRTITGVTRSVEFTWPADEMTVEIRESVPSSLFLFQAV